MTPSDDDLLAAAQRDPAAFGAIFDRHFAPMFRFAAHRLGRESAEDVASETFVRALAALPRAYTTDGSLRAWLYAITANLVRDELRRQARASRAGERLRHHAAVGPDAPGQPGGEAPDAALLAAVATLRADEQETLLLFAWGELSYDEIAAATDVAVGTVRSRLSRARTQLRAALDPRPAEPIR